MKNFDRNWQDIGLLAFCAIMLVAPVLSGYDFQKGRFGDNLLPGEVVAATYYGILLVMIFYGIRSIANNSRNDNRAEKAISTFSFIISRDQDSHNIDIPDAINLDGSECIIVAETDSIDNFQASFCIELVESNSDIVLYKTPRLALGPSVSGSEHRWSLKDMGFAVVKLRIVNIDKDFDKSTSRACISLTIYS